MHRLLRILSTTLITAGLVVLADVGLTLAWKEPVSSIYGSLQQGQAEDELADLEERFPSRDDLAAAADAGGVAARARVLADRFSEQLVRGDGIGRIAIERIGLDAVFVEGTDTDSLRKGPAHYARDDAIGDQRRGDGSALPGQGETVGIAGHRTTYLAPFRRIDEIRDGDEIVVGMPYGTFTYRVEGHEIVSPEATRVVRDVDHERLVLTACHPLYSAAERYVVYAQLEGISLSDPGGSG
ncbi:MAG TPA: class E sortase [Solirubrobacterales bacterium]|nr:class E sortase [Solirubrobacterales bacterium]